MESDVGCSKCRGQYILKDGILICQLCGMIAPYQPKPSYDQLEKENEELKQKLGQIKEMISDMEINYVSMKEIKKLIVNL